MTPKVLVVDDEKGTRNLIHHMLKDQYEVVQATDQETALKMLEEDNQITVVLLDILLPKINGIQILKQIKGKNPEIRVIMMSVVKEVDTVVQAMKLGAVDYITKDFDEKQLLDVIGNVTKKE